MDCKNLLKPNNMKGLKIIRKEWGHALSTKQRDIGPPLMRIVIPNADIYFRKPTLDLIGLSTTDESRGLCFGFGAQGAFVRPDDDERAFRLHKMKSVWAGLKFKSKPLMLEFIDHFALGNATGSVWFMVHPANKDGWHKLELVEG